MSSHLQYLLLGTGSGAVVAALALGIVITYRASGVVNFAHAAMGMFLAYTYAALRTDGDLLVPVLGLPGRISLLPENYRFAWGTAFAITMGLAALYGLAIHTLVFRPLRNSPALAKVVASLGLFLYLLAIANLRIGTQGASVAVPENLLPDDVVRVLGTDIQADRLWLAAIVALVTVALALLYQRTGFGLATRAAAESEKGAVLLGHSPDRLAALNWMLATMLAGAAVILFAPITSINPSTTSLLFVPAVAAALVGGFRSFALTALAGLAIGMAQSEIQNLHGTYAWLPDVNLEYGLPFLVIIVTMVVRGETLPTRGSLHRGHFPPSPAPRRRAWWVAVLAGGGIVAALTLGTDWRAALIVTATSTVLALSVVFLTGYIGQISLMPMALAGISAFSLVKLHDVGVPFPFTPVLAALVAVAVGLVAGVPAVRVRGMNLAIATLAAAVAIEELVLKWEWFTGGAGGTEVPAPSLFGIDLDVAAPGSANNRPAFAILTIVVAALCALAVCNLRRGRTGLALLAVRANERAAAAARIDVTRAKLAAFGISSFIAGLGGALYAYAHPNLSVNSFVVFQSLTLLALTYLGGIASVAGALTAAALADGGLVTTALGSEGSQTQYAVNGLMLMAVAVLYPAGISGAVYRLRDRLTRRVAARREQEVVAAAATPAPAR